MRHNDIQLDAGINQGGVYVSNRIAAHQQPQSAPLLVSAQLSRPASRSAGAGRSAQFCRKGSRPRFTDPGHRSSRRIPSMPQSPRSVEQAGGRALVNEPWWCRALKCVEKRGVFRLLPTHDSITGGTDAACHTPSRSMAHCTKLLWFACCKERTERNK